MLKDFHNLPPYLMDLRVSVGRSLQKDALKNLPGSLISLEFIDFILDEHMQFLPPLPKLIRFNLFSCKLLTNKLFEFLPKNIQDLQISNCVNITQEQINQAKIDFPHLRIHFLPAGSQKAAQDSIAGIKKYVEQRLAKGS